MIVTSKISADFTRQGTAGKVNAVQGDGNTRQLEITYTIVFNDPNM